MTQPPIVREILVDAGPQTAFEVFTDRIGSWWPVADHSVHGAGSDVAFVDGRIVETAHGLPDVVWGSVTVWEPPSRVAFTWRPGRSALATSAVEVTFTAEGERTRVRLVHAGWESYGLPAAARAEYEQGWPVVVGAFRDEVARVADVWTWVALLHTPAADDVAPEGIFADPRFAAHVAFLQRMAEAGYLVAAGPFLDEDGSGMTVLRLPGADRLPDVERLATHDDESVATGFFSVRLRPWDVVLSAT